MKLRLKGLIALSIIFSLPSSSFAQDAKLISEAKKEGKVVAYGSLESDIMDELDAAGFAEKRKEYRKIFFQ